MDKASAEAEDIQHAGIFLGCPLVIGTSGTFSAEDSCLSIIHIYIAIHKNYNNYTIHSSNCTYITPLLPDHTSYLEETPCRIIRVG